jgi:hypothetical protein
LTELKAMVTNLTARVELRAASGTDKGEQLGVG